MPGILTGPGTPGNTDTKAAQARAKYAAFIKKVHDATGIDIKVLTAWATIENGPAGNPLNIGPGKNYGSQDAAATATINLLRTNGSYAPILKAASQNDIAATLHAIIVSPWDAGHYSGGTSTPGASILGVYSGLYGTAPGIGIPKTVTNAAGAVADALNPLTYITQAENWASNAALRALLYVVFTAGAFALIILALRRATVAAPGPAGYAKSVPGRVADRVKPSRVFGF